MLTREQVLKNFIAQGVTIAEWSRQHGFSYANVRNVLYTPSNIRYGEKHRIAVALGLKDPRPDPDHMP